MTNTELIKALRCCGSMITDCKKHCPYYEKENCSARKDADAADALEAAEKRIAELEKQGSVEMHKKQVARIAELEALKEESERQIEDLQTALTACRLRKDEAQFPKDGECEAKKPKIVKETEYSFYCDCPTCGGRLIGNVDGEWCAGSFDRFCRMCGQKIDWSEYCGWSNKPNCGARMKGEHDEN